MPTDERPNRAPARSPLEIACFNAGLSFVRLAEEARKRGVRLHYSAVSRINTGGKAFREQHAEIIAEILQAFGVPCNGADLKKRQERYLSRKPAAPSPSPPVVSPPEAA